jgi:hypothetical protein
MNWKKRYRKLEERVLLDAAGAVTVVDAQDNAADDVQDTARDQHLQEQEDLTSLVAALGGDWDLEVSAGEVETVLVIGEGAQRNWGNVLALGIQDRDDLGGGTQELVFNNLRELHQQADPDVVLNCVTSGSRYLAA